MTKQEICDKISEMTGIDKTILGDGSTLYVDWLRKLHTKVNPNEIASDLSKHDCYDDIVKWLGGETSDDYKEDGYKSDMGTITTLGVDYIRTLIERWKNIADAMSKTKEIQLVPFKLTEIIVDDYLTEWIQMAGAEQTSVPAEGFGQLNATLMSYAAFNDAGIMGPEHVEFCIGKLMADAEPGRENDTSISVGDTSEDAPSQETLSHAISSQMEQPGIETLVGRINRGVLDLDPPWQRKRVWSESKQRKLIRSIILGLPLPSFILFKPRGSSNIEVVDGKQRLSSFHDYVKGRMKFPRISVAEDVPLGSFTLRDCSDKYFNDLPKEAQEKFLATVVHTSTLKDVEPETIYEVFTIYNSSGTRLNAVEIRNAAFQQHEIHKSMVVMSGEQIDQGNWSQWTVDLRNCVGNTNLHQNRYKYLAFLERYLGYSRSYNELGRSGFKKMTTTKSIKAFYEHENGDDPKYAKIIQKEVMTVFEFCYNEVRNPFSIAGKFHALKATNSLILCRLMYPLIEKEIIKKEKAVEYLDLCVQHLDVPPNQNTTTIWGYHIESITNLWEKLNDKQKKSLDAMHSNYLDLLLPARNI